MCELWRGRGGRGDLSSNTGQLLDSSPGREAFLQIEHAVKKFSQGGGGFLSGIFRRRGLKNFVRAVDDISLDASEGDCLVILGESGSGKTTLGRLIVGLEQLDSGQILLEGEAVKFVRDRGAKRGRLQMVFQDPGSSLDPFMSVKNCVEEPLRKLDLPRSEKSSKVVDALELVGLGSSLMGRRTSELSGGQKQRVAIARALISDPQVIVLDEPTSSIDVSIQAQVLNLLVDLQRLKGLTYVLISHDPNVARFMADTIAVMHLGKVVEYGPSKNVLDAPKHPYTQALLASAPKVGKPLPLQLPQGDPQSIIVLPSGCRYHPRCSYAMKKCSINQPNLLPIDSNESNLVSCFLYNDN
jgi:oligopeptide/dipeptide ABC transporter ATP-binding protein